MCGFQEGAASWKRVRGLSSTRDRVRRGENEKQSGRKERKRGRIETGYCIF